MADVLEIRKEKVLKFLKSKKIILAYVILAIIVWIGFNIRTQNLPLLIDVTTGNYIPVALDPFAFLRYAQMILENGVLPEVDLLRYYPLGFNNLQEFSLLAHFVVYLFQFLSFFNPGITLEYVHVLYPPIAFGIGLIFFFLLVKKLFNYKVGLLASGFLIILPAFLYRTTAGFADKEALATMFMFMAFYFFVSAWKSKSLKGGIFLGILGGVFTGLMGSVWNGVTFIFITIGVFGLIELLLNKFGKKEIGVYASWLIATVLFLKIFYPAKYGIMTLLASISTMVMFLTLGAIIVKYFVFDKDLFKIKSKIEEKIPLGFASILITILVGLIVLSIFQGPLFFIGRIQDLFISLTKPFGTNRWVVTVAEAHQPYVTDWIGQFTLRYIWMFIIGSVVLFYELVKPLKKHGGKLTLAYAIFIIGFIFSRYSQNSQFDGVSGISQLTYIGSLFFFVIVVLYYYFYAFYKDKELFDKISKLKWIPTFIFIWFLITIIGARSAIRLLFVFAPITAVLGSYILVYLFDKIPKIKGGSITRGGVIISLISLFFLLSVGFQNKLVSAILLSLAIGFIIAWIASLVKTDAPWHKFFYLAVLFIAITSLSGFAEVSSNQAKNTGPSYNQQWQQAGAWIRENTPEDAVFAHWWDYGYWVQTGGQRATLSDGGNGRGAINHFIGRHVLTAQDETEALELLKANDATHLLMISDEIGKYPAYSSIGADESYDRYASIPVFTLDASSIQETRNGTLYVYRGGVALDEDFIYQDQLIPRNSAVIGGILVPLQVAEDGSEVGFSQPFAVLVLNGQQVNIPLQCIFFNDREYIFEDEGLEGCLRIIPVIQNDQVNALGAGLYVSPKVKRTLFTQLFLFDKETDAFKVAYNDAANLPLSLYNGRLIGPLKIWNITYPGNLEVPPEYYGTEVPNPAVNDLNSNFF